MQLGRNLGHVVGHRVAQPRPAAHSNSWPHAWQLSKISQSLEDISSELGMMRSSYELQRAIARVNRVEVQVDFDWAVKRVRRDVVLSGGQRRGRGGEKL